MVLGLLIFGFISTSAHQGTISYEECKASKFEAKSCWNSEQLYKSGKFLCELQGKPFADGSSDCK